VYESVAGRSVIIRLSTVALIVTSNLTVAGYSVIVNVSLVADIVTSLVG
jgi:hypothetical protein